MPRLRAVHLRCCAAREFYDHHRAHRDPFYTDRVIHSPGVPVFRDDRGRLLDDAVHRRIPDLAGAERRGDRRRTPRSAPPAARPPSPSRAERVLETAAAHGYRRLVLGAWGCGVFRNDPAQVAGAFRALLTDGGRFAGPLRAGRLRRPRPHDRRGDRSAFERAFAARPFAGRERSAARSQPAQLQP